MARYAFTSALATLAEADHGLVTRDRLLSLNFSDNDIADGLVRSLLFGVVPGVYSIGRRTLGGIQLRRAATMHAAPAMLRGRSAAEHRELLAPRTGVVTVATTRRGVGKSLKTEALMSDGQPGLILVRPTRRLVSELVDGVPTATVPRMLAEVAAAESEWILQRVWKQADYRGMLDLAAVDHALKTERRAGNPLVRELFLQHPGRFGVAAHYESPAEVAFRQLVHDAGLADPEVNVPLMLGGARYIADFFWRWLGLVVEVDDPSHGRPLARASDIVRDADFIEAGLTILRFTTERLRREPERCMEQLAVIIDRLSRQIAA